jgi:2-isopropylmalate synthase
MEVSCKTGEAPHAKLSIRVGDQVVETASEGSGPVDAVFKAIEKQFNSGADLLLYSVNAITQGTEAVGDVTVRLERNGQLVNGVGADTDVLAASAKAYLHALNLLEVKEGKAHPQHGI